MADENELILFIKTVASIVEGKYIQKAKIKLIELKSHGIIRNFDNDYILFES